MILSIVASATSHQANSFRKGTGSIPGNICRALTSKIYSKTISDCHREMMDFVHQRIYKLIPA